MVERWILGTRWNLFPVRIATYLCPVGLGAEPRPDSQSHHAPRMVSTRTLPTARAKTLTAFEGDIS